MADFVFKSRKQYWSAVKNLHGNINNNTKDGKALRKQFARLTGDKKYRESNWKKEFEKGKHISLKEFRSDFGKVKKEQTDNLKQAWREEKAGGNKITWKEYQQNNSQPDYDGIKEQYNSPK